MTITEIITSEGNWIEGEAIRQLEKTAELPGMIKAVGLPELHPGKGIPVGAVFATVGVFYPHLVGNDVGCGMALWKTDLKVRKIKLDRWAARLNLEKPLSPDEIAFFLEKEGIDIGASDPGLGSIGGGNHFAELQKVEKIEEPELFEKFGLSTEELLLLVHSGSRGLGEALLRSHVEQHKAGGLMEDSDDADRYIARHDHALKWAIINRNLIARRFLDALGADGELVLDRCHNSVAKSFLSGLPRWIHRKGAVPSEGPTVIAGSRDTLTHLVVPHGDQEKCLHSITHGAGRKWKRGDAKARLRSRFSPETLTHTDSGGRVICEDRELLYDEAPQAYKDVETVVKSLFEAGLIRKVASLRPVITYKTRAGIK